MTDKHTSATHRRRVDIILESFAAGERIVRRMDGDLFLKGEQVYVRYDEPHEAEMGRTVTMVKAGQGELRIVRHGDIRLEQTFIPGKRHTGYLQTPQGRIELETETLSLDVRQEGPPDSLDDISAPGGPLTIAWSYKLSVMGEDGGEYRLLLRAVPQKDSDPGSGRAC
ncbi:DUF1934 domain-containing protein [Paenibacillus sp. JMULE4]|uniref:DUF1934 domain-containing protein n=1 Tax=Paenibacillus TaxID=44249 RepID=UPI00157688E5|nr:DUF1934 domain-containing protein [Paenibacillus sp. JMULE4]NTZ19639.1 DUF1934 domain-containing protein [Paenibacillus sp. JMULE4]